MSRLFVISAVLSLAVVSNGAFAATSFQNLGFDDRPLPNGTQSGDTAIYLSKWRLFYDGVEQKTINVDNRGNAGAEGFAVIQFNYYPWTGRYTPYFENGFYNNEVHTWAISQRGTIASDVRSLTFVSTIRFKAPSVSIDGQTLPVFDLGLSHFGDFELYGADISSFAGREVDLTFFTRPVGILDAYSIDEIQFSPISIPEPSPLYLLMCGLLLLLVCRRSKCKKWLASLWCVHPLLAPSFLFTLLLANITCDAQSFQNLGFDAGPSLTFGQQGNTSVFLPGWTLRYDGSIRTNIDVDTTGNAGIEGAAVLNGAAGVLPYPAEKSYCLVLRNGFWLGNTQTWEITQSGTVPSGTHSLFFKSAGQTCALTINSTPITPTLLRTENGFGVYSADISAYAGQTVTLKFSTRLTGFLDIYVLDSISLSP